MEKAIQKAVEAAGSNARLAEILGVHPSFISQLVNGHRKLPWRLCHRIESQLGISRKLLRPDIFGDEAA